MLMNSGRVSVNAADKTSLCKVLISSQCLYFAGGLKELGSLYCRSLAGHLL